MSRMFLVSMLSNVENLLQEVEPDYKGRTITFIPTAANAETLGFLIRFERFNLRKLGFQVEVLDVAKASYERIKHTIEKNDYIYVCGGNTFYLLQEMRKSGADQIITQELEKGKLYIGESAGSIVVAPNIEYIALMDSAKKAPKLTEYSGLHFNDFYVVPHYHGKMLGKEAEKIVKEYGDKLDLRILTDNQAIYVKDGVEKMMSVENPQNA